MTLLFLLISLCLIWANLIGLGLLGEAVAKDYPVSRIGSALFLCLVFFFAEHFYGLGPRLWLLPFSSVLSAWMIWSKRSVLRENWSTEASFGAGVLLCLGWRYVFPNIDLFEERFPDLVFIHNYYAGVTLPAPDRWLPPFKADFYYSFQFYSAALMGRWFDLDRGVCYQLSYAVLSGFIASSIFMAARRLCSWRPGPLLLTLALLVGGTGLSLVAHLSIKPSIHIQNVQLVRYLGMIWSDSDRTDFGKKLDHLMYGSKKTPVELPVEPLSTVLLKGEFHPPLTGYMILAFSLLVIATLEGEADPGRRRFLNALLAATVPLSLIGNTWVFPLQTILVAGWLVYRALSREKGLWLPAFFGAGVATALAYPFLSHFLMQSTAHTTELRLVPSADHASVAEWLAVFWPLVAIAALSLLKRERRPLTLYFICVWAVLLAATEIFYNHDINSGTWERFNSTLKWWGWIYTGGILTLAALNMGSRNRVCRYGTILFLLVPCLHAYDLFNEFKDSPKDDMGKLDGTNWITRDYTLRDIVSALKARPDGICIDSGDTTSNTDATVIPIYANKQCLVGWPVQEGIWREFRWDIHERIDQENAFYAGKMEDPVAWLLANNIRYVLWLQKDNDHLNARFVPLWNKIRSHYRWQRYCGNDADWSVGFWERVDPPSAR